MTDVAVAAGGNNLAGTVSTPTVPQQPIGPHWDALEKATTGDEMQALWEYAKAHGFHPDGQFLQAWADKAEQVLGGILSEVAANVVAEMQAKRESHAADEMASLDQQIAALQARKAKLTGEG